MRKAVAIERPNDLLHIVELQDTKLDLDLNADVWELKPDQASEKAGTKLAVAGASEPGARRVPLALPFYPDTKITCAAPLNASGLVTKVQTYSVEDVTPGQNWGSRDRNHPATSFLSVTPTWTYAAATGVLTASAGTPLSVYVQRSDDRFCIPQSDNNAYYGAFDIDGAHTNTTIRIKPGLFPDGTVFYGCDILGRPCLTKIVITSNGYRTDLETTIDGQTLQLFTKSPQLYDKEGPFKQEDLLSSPSYTTNEDERMNDETSGLIHPAGLYSAYRYNDSVFYYRDVGTRSYTPTTPSTVIPYKYKLYFPRQYTFNGLFMSDGRRVWRVAEGKCERIFDSGDDDDLGIRWDICRIGTNLFIMVNEKRIPRILRLNAEELKPGQVSGLESYAGSLPVWVPTALGSADAGKGGWGMDQKAASGGALTAGAYKVKVRAVNIEDNLQSTFLQVREGSASGTTPLVNSASGDESITVANNDALTVYTQLNNGATDGFGWAWSPRWSHIEVYRTTSGGDTYYLESRLSVDTGPTHAEEDSSGIGGGPLIAQNTENGTYPVALSDALAVALPTLSATDLLAGNQPPICKQAISYQDVTFFFGAAHPDAKKKYSRPLYNFAGRGSVDWENSLYRFLPTAATDAYEIFGNYYQYVNNPEDKLVIEYGGNSSGNSLPVGEYEIEGGGTAQADRVFVPDLVAPTGTYTDVRWYIKRDHDEDLWPIIDNDEIFYHTRTDEVAPESVLSTEVTLSSTGDTFQRACKVGNYLAVVMRKGAHLLYFVDGEVVVDTISTSGDGTPWPRSVIPIANVVVWAHPLGPKIMKTSNASDIAGHRAAITDLGDGRFQPWFKEAYDMGDDIDTGYDEVNGVLRFRRTMVRDGVTSYQALEFSTLHNDWGTVEDDNGVSYVYTSGLEPTINTSALYSVTAEGGIFRVSDHDDEVHPYRDLVVQDTLTSPNYTILSNQITRRGGGFSPSMRGDSIRLMHDGVEHVRTILTATTESITFDDFDDLEFGDTFVIGGVRYRVRYAPVKGNIDSSVKTIEGLCIRARRRLGANPGRITCRVYQDGTDTPIDVKTVDIFDPNDPDRTIYNRIVPIEGQGAMIELELEHLSGDHFILESVELRVREEPDMLTDVEK